MDLNSLITECTAYDFKVMLEEKKPKSWLKSVSALDGYKDELKLMFKSNPISDYHLCRCQHTECRRP